MIGKRERLEAINCHFLRLIETTGTSLRPEFTTNSHISSTPLYGHWLSASFFIVTILCQFEDVVLCSNNDRFQPVNTILGIKITDSNE